MRRLLLPSALALLCLGSAPASADAPKPPPAAKAAPALFPAAAGTTFTFTSTEFKSTWTTKLAATGKLLQYAPHEDILNYFAKVGFRIDADGIYIVGETLGDPAPPPAKAISFPFKKGTKATVPGLIPTTYTVGKRETVKVPAGRYNAWKITLSDKANPSGAVWLAPGVGIVKIQLPSGRIDELVKIEPPAP